MGESFFRKRALSRSLARALALYGNDGPVYGGATGGCGEATSEAKPARSHSRKATLNDGDDNSPGRAL